MMSDREKRTAGESAAALVRDGMVIGLGTGTTMMYAIKQLGELVRDGLSILAVPTSHETEMLAIEEGIPLTSLWKHTSLDLAIDGADQVDSKLNAIKGGGGAHTREKVVACSAKRFVVAIEENKLVDVLNHPVPLEVLPCAWKFVETQVKELGGKPQLRLAQKKDGPAITDNGNFIIDVDFGKIIDPLKLSEDISTIPGVIEHGIFTNINEVHVGRKAGVDVLKRKIS
ncbi:MAG: ribose-5-phosphate isomerase RpiA [Methanocellales archaeon]|nr:ribose-5-phosphate isomerase RpiA [Methanocellales archaeon]